MQARFGTVTDVSKDSCLGHRYRLMLRSVTAQPPAPPKQFTDEELKQQYGIHLATRLQADESGKGAKWADEDDEDDWAPDTVEWMDGTKSSLQPSENEQAHILESSLLATKRKAEESDQASPDSPQAPASILGPGKTILRPGIRATASQTRPGLVLKSVPENAPTPVKPPTPGPFRSPWASLPPVDKVSPISFNPPMHREQPLHISTANDAEMSQVGRPLPSPPREIAADTFDRSWRDDGRGSRELFDSRSGRYEPVKATRRGSMRQDGGFRPPAVLQRPSQPHVGDSMDQSGAQGSRVTGGSQDARNWDRRTSSSAIDNRAGPDRRTSTDLSVASNDARSEVRQSPVSTKPTISDHQPSSGPHANAVADASSIQRAYSAHGPPNGVAPVQSQESNADVTAMQQQIMRQKLEANRKRKEDEQAREEAAKQERIRQKLQSLGELPKKDEKQSPEKKDIKLEHAPVSEDSAKTQPPQIQSRVESNTFSVSQNAQPPQHEIMTHLDGLGEIPADIVRKAPSGLAITDSAAIRSTALLQPSPEARSAPPPQTSKTSPSPSNVPGGLPIPKSVSDPVNILVGSNNQSNAVPDPRRNPSFERQNQHWNRGPTAFHAPPGWTAGAPISQAPSAGNVWGPPTKDKTLGNGAFESEVPRVSSMNFPSSHPSLHHSSQSPGPIAPPSSSSPRPNGQALRGDHRLPNAFQGHNAEWVEQEEQRHARAPFASDSMRRQHRAMVGQTQDRPRGVGSGWLNGFKQAEQARLEEERNRPQNEPEARFRPVYHETFRKTVPNDILGGEPRIVSVHTETTGQEPHPGQQGGQQHFNGIQRSQPLPNNARSASRFFGNQHGAFGHPNRPMSFVRAGPGSQTAGLDEALFSDDLSEQTHHPLVKLPPQRPKVKLPAPRPPQQHPQFDKHPYDSHAIAQELTNAASASMQPRQTPVRFGQQPIVQNAEWQNRFDSVTGRKPNQPPTPGPHQRPMMPAQMTERPQPLIVTSSSTPPMDIDGPHTPATVSLPQTKPAAKDPAAYSLPAEHPQSTIDDQYLWDEPEVGSKPTVSVSRILPSLSWGSNKHLANHRKSSFRPLPIQATTCSDVSFDTGPTVRIHLRGRAPLEKPLVRRAGQQNKAPGKQPRKNKKKAAPGSKAGKPPTNAQAERKVQEPSSADQPKMPAEGRMTPKKRSKQAGGNAQRADPPGDGARPTKEHAAQKPPGEKRGNWAKSAKTATASSSSVPA